MEIEPIKSKRDYRRALKEIEGLMRAKRNTPQGDRLDVLLPWSKPGKQNITRSICPIRSRRSNITWSRPGLARAI